MGEEVSENKYKYTAESKLMKDYYEGEFEAINSKNVRRMLVFAIFTGFYLLYVYFCEWMHASGRLSVDVVNLFRMVLFICLLITSYFYFDNIVKALFHRGYEYDAEHYFNYNCLVGNPIKDVYVLDSRSVKVIYIMRGIRYARLDGYTVRGGIGRVRVVDTIEKVLQV